MTLVRTDPLLDLRSVALDPPKDRRRVDIDTPLLHHLGEVSVTDRVLAVPAHAQQDDRDRKATALEQKQQDGSSGSRPPHSAKVNTTKPSRTPAS